MADTGKKKYKNNYLTQVICQFVFDENELINDKSLKEYRERLGDGYASLSSIVQQGIIIEDNGSDITTEKDQTTVWEILSSDNNHKITINQQSFAITFTSYTKLRDLAGIIEHAHGVFFEQFNTIQTINRLGLRYINQIRVDDTEVDWSRYIAPELTASFNFEGAEKVRRSMHTMIFVESEDLAVNFNYGIYNRYFPAPITENEFIIDLDAYTPFSIKVENPVERLKEFSKVLAIYFESSITDALRENMEVIDE